MNFIISSDRKLGNEERKNLETEARLMQRLDLKNQWVGDGMLYQTTNPKEFFFYDQKYKEDTK